MIKVPKDGLYRVYEIDVPFAGPVSLKADQIILYAAYTLKESIRMVIMEPYTKALTEEKKK